MTHQAPQSGGRVDQRPLVSSCRDGASGLGAGLYHRPALSPPSFPMAATTLPHTTTNTSASSCSFGGRKPKWAEITALAAHVPFWAELPFQFSQFLEVALIPWFVAPSIFQAGDSCGVSPHMHCSDTSLIHLQGPWDDIGPTHVIWDCLPISPLT